MKCQDLFSLKNIKKKTKKKTIVCHLLQSLLGALRVNAFLISPQKHVGTVNVMVSCKKKKLIRLPSNVELWLRFHITAMRLLFAWYGQFNQDS